ncbi:MAG: leishmanolysin-related zinc metalloendopeptidase, partial [Microthrixaceae bacterium]
ATGNGSPAPVASALSWTISDPGGLPLICGLDTDGNGSTDLTVAPCTSDSVRTVNVATAGLRTFTLTVDNGAAAPTVATTSITPGVAAAEPFNIDIQFVGSFTPARTAAFQAAAARWSQVIHAGLPDLSLSYPAAGCGADAPAFSGVIDDVSIIAAVVPIDGPSNVLANAGPCYFRTSSGLALAGSMRFDVADIDGLEASGNLVDVVTHEMGHVLGIGTLNGWSSNLLTPGTSTVSFTGARARGAWQELGGSGAVPVENNGVPGTTDSHWRESTFNTELMTGYEDNGPDPLSRLTIAALGDFGYSVDLAVADAYSLPGAGLRSGTPTLRAETPFREELLRPVGGVG